MGFNHRFALRLTTDMALAVFLFYTIGLVLWVIDTVLNWNILPDWIDQYAQVIILVFGVLALMFVIASMMLSLALLAQSAANRSGLPDFKTPPIFKKIASISVATFVVLLVVLQTVDLYRKNAAAEAAKLKAQKRMEEYRETFEQTRQSMNDALPGILRLFPPDLLQALAGGTFTKKEHLAELSSLLRAIAVSTPNSPELRLLLPAKPPYRYFEISDDALLVMKDDTYTFEPKYYIGFPTELEEEIVRALFSGTVQPLSTRLEGQFITNAMPSSWGVLKYRDKIIALVVLQGTVEEYTQTMFSHYGFWHKGPDALYSNN